MNRRLLENVIRWWKDTHKEDDLCGMDELMGVVKDVYERVIVQSEDTAFFQHLAKVPSLKAVQGSVSITDVKLNTENLTKVMQHRRAFLLNDAQLHAVRKTGVYQKAHAEELFLDNFVCQKETSKTSKGLDNFPCNAAAISWKLSDADNDPESRAQNNYFGGMYHLAFFEDNVLCWAVENMCLSDSKIMFTKHMATLQNPRLYGSSIIDVRPTYEVGADYGHRLPGTTDVLVNVKVPYSSSPNANGDVFPSPDGPFSMGTKHEDKK